MVSPEEVREQTRKVLSGANLESSSGRTIRLQVGEALKMTTEEIKIVRNVIEVY